MKLLRAVVDIDQQQIVQKKILEEIVAVILFLVRHEQILNLADSDFGDHQRIITLAGCRKNVRRLIVFLNLHQITVSDDLAVHRCRRKSRDETAVRFCRPICQHNGCSGQIGHTEIYLCDVLQFFKTALHDLGRNHGYISLSLRSDHCRPSYSPALPVHVYPPEPTAGVSDLTLVSSR